MVSYCGMEDDVQFLGNEPEKPASPRRKTYAVTALFVFALIALMVFSWRVFAFYRAIAAGDVIPALAYSTDDFTRAGAAVLKLSKQSTANTDVASGDDPSLGSSKAPITIVEFADFGCPYSQEASYVVRAVAKQFPNDVRVIYRDLPLDDLHPGASLAAEAGECAQEQNMFWEFHDTIYGGSVEFTQEGLLNAASSIGLNEEAFTACLASRSFEDEVNSDLLDGAAAGVVGTPTFFFNGVKVEGSIPFSVFNEIVHALLEG